MPPPRCQLGMPNTERRVLALAQVGLPRGHDFTGAAVTVGTGNNTGHGRGRAAAPEANVPRDIHGLGIDHGAWRPHKPRRYGT